MSILQLFTIIARLQEDVESNHLKVPMAITREENICYVCITCRTCIGCSTCGDQYEK
jgi:hypothetical protein